MLAVRKQEWKKPAMRAVTDTGIILECLYDAYGMEGEQPYENHEEGQGIRRGMLSSMT